MTDYKVGDTIKTQDTFYEYILVIRDMATAIDDMLLRAEVVRYKLLNYNVAIPADWPVQKIGAIMTLVPEEISPYEEPVNTKSTPSMPSMPGKVVQRATVTLDIDDDELPAHDAVNHPKHYTSHPSGVECIQITEHMGFNLGNALKYIWRANLKNHAIEDMNKAIWYIERELEKRNGS